MTLLCRIRPEPLLLRKQELITEWDQKQWCKLNTWQRTSCIINLKTRFSWQFDQEHYIHIYRSDALTDWVQHALRANFVQQFQFHISTKYKSTKYKNLESSESSRWMWKMRFLSPRMTKMVTFSRGLLTHSVLHHQNLCNSFSKNNILPPHLESNQSAIFISGLSLAFSNDSSSIFSYLSFSA